jgi:ABC-type amino acid transport substrate-binding protein
MSCTVEWQIGSWGAMIAAEKAGLLDMVMGGIMINDECRWT